MNTDLALIALHGGELLPTGLSEKIILTLDYELLSKNPAERMKVDAALGRLLAKHIIEIVVEDDFDNGIKTLTLYRFGQAPTHYSDGRAVVLISHANL